MQATHHRLLNYVGTTAAIDPLRLGSCAVLQNVVDSAVVGSRFCVTTGRNSVGDEMCGMGDARPNSGCVWRHGNMGRGP